MRLTIALATALAVASPTAAQTTRPPGSGKTDFNIALMMLGNYIAGWECLRKKKTLDEAFLIMSMQDLGEKHFGMKRAEVGAFIKAATDHQLAEQAKSGKCVDADFMVLWPQFLADAFIELGKEQR